MGTSRRRGFESANPLDIDGMNIVSAMLEFTAGLQNIEREIISKVRDAGGAITDNYFKWHRGKELAATADGCDRA